MPIKQGRVLDLNRCVHCGVDKPSIPFLANAGLTIDHADKIERNWVVYSCTRCGGAILTSSYTMTKNYEVIDMYPKEINVDEEIPLRPKEYLEQAINSLSSPAGSVMLTASSIDSMMKAKGLITGSLYSRIKEAAETHLITEEMATWAHEVRLDANDQRHADDEAPLPSCDDAKRAIEFARALATFLFVLPARVQRGIKSVQKN